MRFFDSHCHIDDERSFGKDRAAVIHRANAAGVCCSMVVGVDLARSREAVALAGRHPGLFASVGVHPHDAAGCSDAVITELARMADHPKVRAWGEAGLDFNRMHSPQNQQEHWLGVQVETANRLDLPMIFHERDSEGRFLAMLQDLAPNGITGVVHCFSGNETEMDAYLDLGLHIGITGILTHKLRGEALRRMAVRIPEDRILIETDAPYLTPAPERNRVKRNEPAFVPRILATLSEIRKVPEEDLARTVFANTCRLYKVTEGEIPVA